LLIFNQRRYSKSYNNPKLYIYIFSGLEERRGEGILYILNKIDLERDEILESYPICLREGKGGEIYCMGVLVKREMTNNDFEGVLYYQFVYFYGKSPVNFSKVDYEKLQKECSFDMNLEMVSDFRYCYSDYSSFPGLSESIEEQLMQVSKRYRF
jgi:hypothetical protein